MNASPAPNPQKVRVRSPLPRELADVYPRGTWHGNRKLLRRRRTVLLELPHAGHAIGGMTHQPLHAVAGNHLHLGVEHGLELGLLILVSPAAHTGIAPSLIGNESVFTISPSLVPTAYAAIDTVADETSSSMTRPPSRAVPDTLSPDQTTSSPPI